MPSIGVDTADHSVEGEVSREQYSSSIMSHADSAAGKSSLSTNSEHELCRAPSSCSSEFIQSPLLRLPYELRKKIFWRSTMFVRSPSTEYKIKSKVTAYAHDLLALKEDTPSPLLSVNKQIREEVKDLLKRHREFAISVTCYGVAFIMNSLTTLIAQNRPKSYNGLSKLHISIWPPHPHRPVDMFYLDRHLQKLQFTLCALPQIPKLIIWFHKHNVVKWCGKGWRRAGLRLRYLYYDNDMEMILKVFARIPHAEGTKIRVPRDVAHTREVGAFAAGELTRIRNGYLEFELKTVEDHSVPHAYDHYLLTFPEDWLRECSATLPWEEPSFISE